MATNYSNILLRFDGKVTLARGSTPVRVRGSNGADTVTIEQGVEAVLDGSFNRGNDVVNFAGLASSYSVSLLNSSSILVTDAQGTSVSISVGTTGTTINFADASRTLVGAASGITLGTQRVASAVALVAAGSGVVAPFAPNDDVGVLPGANLAQSNTLVLLQGAQVNLGEGSDPTVIRGTNGIDVVEVATGNILVLDGSFNRGNDTIRFEGLAESYQIVRNGSSAVVITDDAGTSVTIPVGVNGTAIVFADVARELIGGSGGLFLGDQQVGSVPAAIADGGTDVASNFHTLTQIVQEGSDGTPPDFEVFWGFNPDGVGGIPLTALVDFVTTITGLDLTELGLIDDDGTGPFDNVTNLTISNANTLTGSADGPAGDNNDSSPVFNIFFDDGTQQQFNIEAQIGEQYFNFLNNLLFDSDGNSRLFLQEVPGTGTDSSPERIVPIVLTPTENNGGTIELDRTSGADDTIVVGRLELLHQAFIDGGAGYNVLEVEAKGLFAQPLQLLNIQEVRVTDLPNFYTDDDGDNTYPFVSGGGSDDSFLDLTRAGQIELLIVSDQGLGQESDGYGGSGSGSDTDSGDLTIVGVRNGATLRLEGGFNSGTTTVQYADVDPAGLTVQLNVGSVNQAINILQNSAVLNIESQGVSNFIQSFFGGGELTTLNISGTGSFGTGGNLDLSFVNNTPVTINAATNSGGVDIELSGSQNVTIIGSSGDDRFSIQTFDVDGGPDNDETVSITGGAGDNYYEVVGADIVTITNGDGSNNYEVSTERGVAVGSLTIATGNGNNVFELENVAAVELSAGNGNNRVELTSQDDEDNVDPSGTPDFVSNVDIAFGDGDNLIYVQSSTDSISPLAGVVTIEVGTGSNEIAVSGRTINITTGGAGPNTIAATGEAITIDNASSTGSTIVLGGAGSDFAEVINELGGNASNGMEFTLPRGTLEPTVLLNVQAGSGATVLLGLETNESLGGTLTALPGSVISGTDLTLNVRTVADIRAADINGVTSVVLDDDNFVIGQSTDANNAVAGDNASVLILTDTQFLEIGAENFSVDGAIFNTHSFVKIIVTQSTSLTALGVDDLPRNIDLILEVQDGVTLTLTAEQLHTRVAQNGVTLANDGNDDLADGRVIVTGGGLNFDPFNTNDQVQTVIAGRVFFGGSLSADFDGTSAIVNSVFGGYDRPSNPVNEVVLTIDSDTSDLASPIVGFTTFHSNLEIVGSRDVVFSGAIRLGVLNPAGEAGDRPFDIFFADLEGEVVNLTVDNFEYLAQGGGIFGNSETVGAVEVFVNIQADNIGAPGLFGWDRAGAESLVSQGVTQYTVTTIDAATAGGTATILLGDTVEDLEVFALRGNFQDTLVLNDAAFGLNFELQGGGTALAQGPTLTSNVGILVANFAFPGADAAVNIIHSNPADTRPILASGIVVNNADTLSITAPEGDVTIVALDGNGLEELTVSGSGDVTIGGDLPTTIEAIDFSDVDGEASFALDNPAENGITIVGAAGGSTISLDDVEVGDIASIAGAGPITLVIGEDDGVSTPSDVPVDLSSTSLTNVTSVVLEDGATLRLTLAQADAIGAGNFSVVPGGDASLFLEDLGEQPFAVANYADGISVSVVSIVDQPVVTLNAATDLSDIGSLIVPGGVTLNLTAAQFQQLDGGGAITIVPGTGGSINVNITDLTQEDAEGLNLSGINVGLGTLTIALSEDVSLEADVNLGSAEVIIPDDTKLTLASLQQAALETLTPFPADAAEGRTFIGGTGSVLEIAQPSGATGINIDASGFGVDTLRLPALLVSGNNVDFIFEDLAERVTKVIFEGIGNVDGRAQLVVVEEGVTIFGDVSFNDFLLDTEVTDLVVDLQGGAFLGGNLIFSTVQVNDQNNSGTFDGTDSVELVPTYLQTLTINSSGTAANTINGETANVIVGNVTPGAFGLAVGIGSRTNQLTEVVINATQALEIGGRIIFSSHGDDVEGTLGFEPNDGITANDDDSAIATLVVNGTSDVTIGNLDTSDGDIDGLEVVNNSTGTLSATLEADLIRSTDNLGQTTDDALSFTGNDTELTVVGPVDLSDDVITAVTQITIAQGATLTLTQEQFDAIGAAGIIDGGPNGNADLVINGFDGGPFDITDLDPNIDVTLVTDDADTILVGDFTGVSIQVVEGNTLTLTAAQYNQIANNGGTITVVDGPDGGTGVGSIEVFITGLTQADVDAGADNFDLGSLTVGTGGSVNITLGEATVDLGTFVDGVLVAGSSAEIITDDGVKASFTLTDGQTLGVTSLEQTGAQFADVFDVVPGDVLAIIAGGPLTVTGTGFTVVEAKFIPPLVPTGQVDASGINVSELRVLAAAFGLATSSNTEFTIDDLPNSVTLVLYEDPAELGFLDPTFRVIRIEEGITTGTGLVFNDFDFVDEVRSVDLTLEGDVTINGDLSVPTRVDPDKDPALIQQFFQQLTIRSIGADTNTIAGGINTDPLFPALATADNNLLLLNIVADQDLVITGEVTFNARGNDAPGGTNPSDQVATLNVSGTADVTIKALDTTDLDIIGLVINNNGTGTLTVTGGSDALELDGTRNLTFNGTGDIVLDTNDDSPDNNGVEGNVLRTINASGLSGDLTVGVIEDVNNATFTFTSGTGVTTATLIDTGLNSTGTDTIPGNADDTAGWLIDYTNAAPGSEFHLNVADAALVAGSMLTINMGPNGILFIDGPVGSVVDLSDLVLDINTVQSIVLGDEVELILTAAQADGLSIVAGADTNDNDAFGVVTIVDLGDAPVNLLGISPEVAGFASLVDDDVTLAAGTILGSIGIRLVDEFGDSSSQAGNTIRFQTFEQADGRRIDVGTDGVDGDAVGDTNESSTNVVWLFSSIPAPVDTADYDTSIGRLWVTPTLVNAEGGDIEQLFTTLPSTILRATFADIDQLNVFLSGAAVDRILEVDNFVTLGDLVFNDVGSSPDEFLSSLTVRLGGEAEVGNIEISDIVGGANVDPESVYFNRLTLDSLRAVTRTSSGVGDILANENFRNDNDGVAETISGSTNENVLPEDPNVVGDIVGDDTNDQVDLLEVFINTFDPRTDNVGVGPQTGGIAANPGAIDPTRGEAIVIGTITYDSSGIVNPLSAIADPSRAVLDITGDNNVTIAAIDINDADITDLFIDLSGFTAVFDPVINADNTESITLDNLPGGSDDGALAIFQEIEGDELSFFDASTYDADLVATFSQIDSSNDDRDDPANGVDDPADAGSEGDAAFTFTAGDGVSIITLTQVGGNTPTLDADSEWIFDFSQADPDSQLIIDETVDFAVDSYLTLIDAPVYITGDVNLSEVNLELTNSGGSDKMRFFVAAGSSLTISVEQALALGNIEIVGEGTVFLVGDATGLADDYLQLQTAVVDFSQVVVDDVAGIDFTATLGGAFDNDGVRIGQRIIGTDFDDDLTLQVVTGPTNTPDNFIVGGLGDDTLTGINLSFGDVFFVVDAGTDTVVFLPSNPGVDNLDIVSGLIVSAGATANATIGNFGASSNFIASALTSATVLTSNAGVANITGPASVDNTIDLSLAAGPNGYNLTGGNLAAVTIIGSAFDDVINGGDTDQQTGDRDILTGGDGDDTFVFNIDISNPAEFTVVEGGASYLGNPGTPSRNALDTERVEITGATASDEGQLVISYRLNGVTTAVTVNILAGDQGDQGLVAAAVAARLNAIIGLNAEVDAIALDTFVLSADDGAAIEFLGITQIPGAMGGVFTFANVAGDGSDADDVTQLTYLDIMLDAATATAGERYSLTIDLRDGSSIVTDTYVATGTETEVQLRDALLDALNVQLNAAGNPIVATAVDDGGITGIQLVGVADEGGFTIDNFTASGAFNGSGTSAQLSLAGDVSDLANADIITDLTAGDLIDLGLDAGTGGLGGNIAFDTGQLNYTDAFNAANTALGGGTIYYFSSILFDLDGDAGTPDEEIGLLFFDANDDGEADGVLILPDVDEADFNASFLIG